MTLHNSVELALARLETVEPAMCCAKSALENIQVIEAEAAPTEAAGSYAYALGRVKGMALYPAITLELAHGNLLLALKQLREVVTRLESEDN